MMQSDQNISTALSLKRFYIKKSDSLGMQIDTRMIYRHNVVGITVSFE